MRDSDDSRIIPSPVKVRLVK